MKHSELKEGQVVKAYGQTYTVESGYFSNYKPMLRIHYNEPANGIRETHIEIEDIEYTLMAT
jgi:hypothetical protein